ncbi:MAG: phosphatidylserine decarboxylase [Treponema sp.]|nr:phosphatidylserine decarboxylase [Treponema sp.]
MNQPSKTTQNDKSTEFLYGTPLGRIVLESLLFLRVPKLLGFLLRTPLSHFYIKRFIKVHAIDMGDFGNDTDGKQFRSFNDFFTRKKPESALSFDGKKTHLISPSDSLLSVYKITDNATFHIKGFDYTLNDFFGNDGTSGETAELTKKFAGGDCLVFRLCATDYHRYCYIDDGHQGKNTFLPGKLYSVQPRAAEHFRIYTKNRRSWAILETENFGTVAQIEVGAFSVGGIKNHLDGGFFKKGDEKGYFDLHGSTIVLLFQKDKIELNKDIAQRTIGGEEARVKYGQFIGIKK